MPEIKQLAYYTQIQLNKYADRYKSKIANAKYRCN